MKNTILQIFLILLISSTAFAGELQICINSYQPGSYDEARKCFLKNAKYAQNFETAGFYLGQIYAEGKGVRPNGVEAYKWFLVSKDDKFSKIMIRALERDLSEVEIHQGRALAAQWIKKYGGQ